MHRVRLFTQPSGRLAGSLVALALLAACQESSTPETPTEPPEFAKGGKQDTLTPFPFDTGVSEPGIPGPTGPMFVPHPQAATTVAATQGQWTPLFTWGSPASVAVHLHMLPDGRVLTWGRVDGPQVWDGSSFQSVPSPSLEFCSGHNFLPDGRLLVAGGHVSDGIGLPNANIFDFNGASWTPEPRMAKGRWYPSLITLPNGEVLSIAGTDSAGLVVTIPEVWTGSSWRRLTTASLSLPYYPRMFVAPDGRVFYAGELSTTRFLNTSGTGHWTTGPKRTFGTRDYGSAVMYEAGKIVYIGGGDPPTNSAEIINLNSASPAWQRTGSMSVARRQINATVLPDGNVFVTGGTSAGGFTNASGAQLSTEMWNPHTGKWTVMASVDVPRLYHGTAILLPDGRVLQSGSGGAAGVVDQRTAQIFSPPYLFKGDRPTITSAPSSVGYGQLFVVQTPNGSAVGKVRFIRLSSVTHAFNAGQLAVSVPFMPATGGLTVTAPRSGNVAPPGFYFLFLVDTAGVPSVAKILNLR